MIDWKPIETMPDGDFVLTWSEEYGYDFMTKSDGVFHSDQGPLYSGFPSHWTPLEQPTTSPAVNSPTSDGTNQEPNNVQS